MQIKNIENKKMGNTFAPAAGYVGISDGVRGRRLFDVHTYFEDAQKYNDFIRTRSDIYVDADVLSGTDMFQATPLVQTYDPQSSRLVTRELDRQWGYEISTNVYRAAVGTWSSEHGRFIAEDKQRLERFNERLERVVLHGEVPDFPINFREGFQRNRVIVRNAIMPAGHQPAAAGGVIGQMAAAFWNLLGYPSGAVVDLGALARDAQNVHTTPVIHFALGRIERWEEFAKTLGIRTDTYEEQKGQIDQVFRTRTAEAGGGGTERIWGYNFGFDVTYFGPFKMAKRVRKIISNVPDNVMSTDFFDGRKQKKSLHSLFDVDVGTQVVGTQAQSLDELFQVHPHLEQEIVVDIELMKAQGYLTFDSAHFRQYGVLRALDDAILRMYHKALIASGWEHERPMLNKTRVEWRRHGGFYEHKDYRWIVGTEQKLPDESSYAVTSVLQQETYQALLMDKNSTFQKPGYTFAKILSLVAVRVLHDPDARRNKDDILRRIEVELTDGIGVCFTGKITRLCNAMIGMEYLTDSIDLTSSLEKLNKIASEVSKTIVDAGVPVDSHEFIQKYKAECTRRFAEEVPNASRADMDAVLSAFD